MEDEAQQTQKLREMSGWHDVDKRNGYSENEGDQRTRVYTYS